MLPEEEEAEGRIEHLENLVWGMGGHFSCWGASWNPPVEAWPHAACVLSDERWLPAVSTGLTPYGETTVEEGILSF